jgi:DNA polymerase I-like protein with 3'-5' exonuclease and polymerase domains
MSKIIVVCEPCTPKAFAAGRAMEPHYAKLLKEHFVKGGFIKREDPTWGPFKFVSLCPPIPDEVDGSDSRVKKWMAPHVEALHAKLATEIADCYIGLGKWSWRALSKTNDSVMKQAGVGRRDEQGRMLFPLLGPRQVSIDKSYEYRMESDVASLMRLQKADWDPEKIEVQTGDYQWVDDLQFLIDMQPKRLAIDTEGSGLRWYGSDYVMYVLQLCWAPGKAVAIPGPEYWDRWRAEFDAIGLDYSKLERVWAQAMQLMADKRIRKSGHNVKYDMHCIERYLGVKPLGVDTENMILINHIDEEMRQKGLKLATMRWAKEMAGYSQKFDIETVKDQMLEVRPADMLAYGCGDSDATFRLSENLTAELMRTDQQQFSIYQRIPQPGLLAAYEMEDVGIPVDKERLREFGHELQKKAEYERAWLLRFTPPAVKRKHLEADKELSFTRPDFTRDIFFSQEGFKLPARVWTKSTKNQKDLSKRVPSVSAKQHLVYFFKDARVIGTDGERDVTVGQYCMRYTALAKIMKMLGTYVGDVGEAEEEGVDTEDKEDPVTGIWKYLDEESRIHPTFKGWGTVTHRLATSDPNSTNWPTRDPELSKPFLSCFTAPKDKMYVMADNSQVELRLVAWAANERAMRKIYKEGGDIHTVTACAVMGIGPKEWAALPEADQKLRRTQAKACNFGFIYGMMAKKFQIYAFTEYGVELTLQDAERFRETFFSTYPDLPHWHKMMIAESSTGVVRSLHGLARHLTGIKSSDEWKVRDAERQGINAGIQGFASQIGQAGHTRLIAQRQPWIQVNNFIHDANYALVDKGYERAGVEALVYSMQSVPLKQWFDITPPVPLIADPAIGTSLGNKFELADMKKKPREKWPDFIKYLQDTQDLINWDASKAPSWWNPQIDHMGVEAFW